MPKQIKFSFLTLLLIFSLTNCTFFVTPTFLPSIQGEQLIEVDENGHVLEDTTYHDYTRQTTLKSNGEYIFKKYIFENNATDANGNGQTSEGWVVDYTLKGTYTWDPATFAFSTQNIVTQENKDGSWTTNSYDSNEMTFFSSRKQGDIYLPDSSDSNTFTNKTSRIYKNNSGMISSKIEHIYSYKITGTTLTFTYMSNQYDADDNLYHSYGYTWTGQIIGTLPAGITWEKGNTVTFHVQIESRQIRSYSNSQWSDWQTEAYEYMYNEQIYHGGDYIIFYNSLDQKSIH